jgi:hypothetical protein
VCGLELIRVERAADALCSAESDRVPGTPSGARIQALQSRAFPSSDARDTEW